MIKVFWLDLILSWYLFMWRVWYLFPDWPCCGEPHCVCCSQGQCKTEVRVSFSLNILLEWGVHLTSTSVQWWMGAPCQYLSTVVDRCTFTSTSILFLGRGVYLYQYLSKVLNRFTFTVTSVLFLDREVYLYQYLNSITTVWQGNAPLPIPQYAVGRCSIKTGHIGHPADLWPPCLPWFPWQPLPPCWPFYEGNGTRTEQSML